MGLDCASRDREEADFAASAPRAHGLPVGRFQRRSGERPVSETRTCCVPVLPGAPGRGLQTTSTRARVQVSGLHCGGASLVRAHVRLWPPLLWRAGRVCAFRVRKVQPVRLCVRRVDAFRAFDAVGVRTRDSFQLLEGAVPSCAGPRQDSVPAVRVPRLLGDPRTRGGAGRVQQVAITATRS
jgi:hypothetical protein